MTRADAGYAAFVLVGAAAAFAIRTLESNRLGYSADDRYRWVGVSSMLGAFIGAKAAMALYLSPAAWTQLLTNVVDLQFAGKSVLGALTGGYLFGELGKRIVGVRYSTGDALAVALPVGHAIGRMGCTWAECCYGAVADVPWAVVSHGAPRHPVQLYESAACFALAGATWTLRLRPRPAGVLFRRYLLGYAAIRFATEFFRGEPQVGVGVLSGAQIYCLLVGLVLVASLRVPSRSARQIRSSTRCRGGDDH